jgi:hypothetical protein
MKTIEVLALAALTVSTEHGGAAGMTTMDGLSRAGVTTSTGARKDRAHDND